MEDGEVAAEAITTGEVRDKSFSLRLRNLRLGVHWRILYTSIRSFSLFPPRSSSSIERHDSRIEFMRRRLFGPVNRLMLCLPKETHGGRIRWVPVVGSECIYDLWLAQMIKSNFNQDKMSPNCSSIRPILL